MAIKTYGKNGQKIKLNKTNVYSSWSSTEPFSVLTGTYYIQSCFVYRGDIGEMVRITNSEQYVGDFKNYVGWIKVGSSSTELVPIPVKKTVVTTTQTTVQTTAQDEDSLRQKPVDFLTKHLGEGSHKVVDIYNGSKLKPYRVGYGDAWCAVAVSAAFIATDLAGKSNSDYPFRWTNNSCGEMSKAAKNSGCFHKGISHIPKKGDILIVNNSVQHGHCGLVTGFSNNKVYTIDGNVSVRGKPNSAHAIRKNEYSWNSTKIYGVITPDYSKKVTTTTTRTTQSTPTSTSTSSSSSSTVIGYFGTKGQGVTLKNTIIYKDNVEKKSTKKYSGTYYIWDTKTYNGRVRICKKASDAGVKDKIVGWVLTGKVVLIVPIKKVTSNFKVGDKVMANNNAVWTNGNWVPLWIRKSVLYVVKIANVEKMGVSTAKGGDVLGYINQKYLRKA